MESQRDFDDFFWNRAYIRYNLASLRRIEMFENGNFCGAFMRIVLWRTASAAAPSAFAVFAAFAFLITLFAVPAQAAAETVDDLFLYFAHEWTYENRMGNLDEGDESVREVSEKGGESLKKIIIAAEPRFGHLGEYWELRALYDVAEPKLTPARDRTMYTNDKIERFINLGCLQKAIEVNPKRAQSIAFLGKMEHEKIYGISAYSQYEADGDANVIPPEKDYIYADALAAASQADPENGWYPFTRATILLSLGDWDEAIESYQRAGACSDYSIGYLFPYGYAKDLIFGNITYADALPGLSAYEKGIFIINFGMYPRFPEQNYIPIKEAYREVSVGIALGKDPFEIYTILHRAACVMGGSRGSSSLDGIVAMTLVNLCAGEMRKYAANRTDMQFAWLAVKAETEAMKVGIRAGTTINNVGSSDIYDLFIEIGNYGALPPDSDFAGIADYIKTIRQRALDGYYGEPREPNEYEKTYALELIAFHGDDYESGQKYIHDKVYGPAFERLKKLDYSNPGEWYENWLVEKKFVREGEE